MEKEQMQTITIGRKAQATWFSEVRRFHSDIQLCAVGENGTHRLVKLSRAAEWWAFKGQISHIMLTTDDWKSTCWSCEYSPTESLHIRVDGRGQPEVWSGSRVVAKHFDIEASTADWLPGLVHVNATRVRDLAALLVCDWPTTLISLDLNSCSELRDLSPLANLTQLTSLDLSGCSELCDIGPLANLTQLTSLDLSGCSELRDIGPLANLTQLTSLDLSGCSELRDIGPLASLTQLISLDLSSCSCLALVAPLAVLPALGSLNLQGCPHIRDADTLCDSIKLSKFLFDDAPTRDIVRLAYAIRSGEGDLANRTNTSAASFEFSRSPELHAIHLVSAVETLGRRAEEGEGVYCTVTKAFRIRGEVPRKTWEALLAAIVRAPDPRLRPAFNIALEDLPLSEIERVLGPALIALANAPASARGWALDLVQQALLPVVASATHAREVAPAAAVFFHAQACTEDVDAWLERSADARVPAWRDRVLVALLDRALRMGDVLEAGRLLYLVQTPEGRDEGRRKMVKILAEKAQFRAVAVELETISDRAWRKHNCPGQSRLDLQVLRELNAIVDSAQRAYAAAQATSFPAEPQAGRCLLLALDSDLDTLADVLTALVQQALDSELVRQLAVMFAPTAGVDPGAAVDALLVHESVTQRTKAKPLAGLRSRVLADRKFACSALIYGTAALLEEEGLVDDDEATKVTAAMLGELV